MERTGKGGVYLGVGPDQNFTYIVSLRPQMAFIVDIRRQNLLLHLLYKALIERARDRVAFVSGLFSRPPPPGIGRDADAMKLMTAFTSSPPSDALFEKNLRDVIARLTEHHHFALTSDDIAQLTSTYTAFFKGGPDIQYTIRAGPSLRFPTWAELVQETDADGQAHGYLASEERFRALREMQERNLIVPIVGDFAGDRALPAIGRYIEEHGARLAAFYVSNVEMYLFQDPTGGAWHRFYGHLAALPVDARSVVIRSFNLGRPAPTGPVRIQLATVLDPVEELLHEVDAGRVGTYADVVAR